MQSPKVRLQGTCKPQKARGAWRGLGGLVLFIPSSRLYQKTPHLSPPTGPQPWGETTFFRDLLPCLASLLPCPSLFFLGAPIHSDHPQNPLLSQHPLLQLPINLAAQVLCVLRNSPDWLQCGTLSLQEIPFLCTLHCLPIMAPHHLPKAPTSKEDPYFMVQFLSIFCLNPSSEAHTQYLSDECVRKQLMFHCIQKHSEPHSSWGMWYQPSVTPLWNALEPNCDFEQPSSMGKFLPLALPFSLPLPLLSISSLPLFLSFSLLVSPFSLTLTNFHSLIFFFLPLPSFLSLSLPLTPSSLPPSFSISFSLSLFSLFISRHMQWCLGVALSGVLGNHNGPGPPVCSAL